MFPWDAKNRSGKYLPPYVHCFLWVQSLVHTAMALQLVAIPGWLNYTGPPGTVNHSSLAVWTLASFLEVLGGQEWTVQLWTWAFLVLQARASSSCPTHHSYTCTGRAILHLSAHNFSPSSGDFHDSQTSILLASTLSERDLETRMESILLRLWYKAVSGRTVIQAAAYLCERG
jgi:hypothetical protein